MSWGTGSLKASQAGYGDPGAWSGEAMDGVDLVSHATDDLSQIKNHLLSEDQCIALMMLVALGLLWLLGGVVFKSARF
jgi:hypothetical protein